MEWRIYDPEAFPMTILSGDVVYVRPESAAPGFRGTCQPLDASSDMGSSHVNLLTNDESNSGESTRCVKRKRLLPVYQQPSSTATSTATRLATTNRKVLVLMTPATLHYRHMAASQTHQNDRVLEIGCSTGMTSAIVWKMQPASWVGFDTGADMVATTLQKRQDCLKTITLVDSHCCCVQIDALKEPERAKQVANQFGPVTFVLMDIGGNRELHDVIDMFDWIMTHIASPYLRMIVIKSQQVVGALRSKAGPDGKVVDGTAWYHEQRQLVQASKNVLPSHPLQAPVKMSPTDDTLFICRYHNYDVVGCLKGRDCPFDHEHCHWCCKPGHVARKCPQLAN